MDKYIIAIGGGELRAKETLEIDRQIADMAKLHVGEKRAVALFIGTASHDFMPYYNTFHKTYTGELGLKTDCVLTVYKEIDYEKIKGKFYSADMIYIGGGDTLFMMDKWKETGIDKLILDAYERGVIVAGLSAGAICWFEKAFTDSFILNGDSKEYAFCNAMGVLKGGACPHFNERASDFEQKQSPLKNGTWYCIENNSAVVFKNGEFFKSLSCGGKSYKYDIFNEKSTKIDL